MSHCSPTPKPTTTRPRPKDSPKLNLRLVRPDEEGDASFFPPRTRSSYVGMVREVAFDHIAGMEGCGRQMGPSRRRSDLVAKTSLLSFCSHRLRCKHYIELRGFLWSRQIVVTERVTLRAAHAGAEDNRCGLSNTPL